MKPRSRIADYALVIFSIVWIVVIGNDYINKHPFYAFSFEYFRFPRLAAFFLVFTSFVSFLSLKYGVFRRIAFSGLGVFITASIYFSALGISFSEYVPNLDFGTKELFSFLLSKYRPLSVLAAISLSAFLYGNIIKFRLLDSVILKIALGVIVICTFIYFLAALGYYNLTTALTILVMPVLFNIRELPKIFKNIFVGHSRFSEVNFWGYFCLLSCIFFLCLNFSHIQSPFPVGFDSRNFYMNIARQVSLTESLVYGHRPYNWSLLISLGFVLTKSSASAVGISFYGFLLSLIAMYHLGVKALKIDKNYVLFSMMIICFTPAIVNQLYIELKTDTGLLFMQLVSILYFLRLFGDDGFTEFVKLESLKIFPMKEFLKSFIILGLLLGFGLTIKMTNMFLVVSLIIAIFWIISNDKVVILSAILMSIILFIVGGLDRLTGLVEYHSGMTYFTAILIIAFIVCGLISFARKRLPLFKATILTLVIGVSAFMPLMPWLAKSYLETGSLNPTTLLNGATVGPDIDLNRMQRNYINTLEED